MTRLKLADSTAHEHEQHGFASMPRSESAGDVVLVRSDPRDVPRIIALSRASYRKMVQNLWWAAGYNIFAILLAAGILAPQGILLPPAVCRGPDVGEHRHRCVERTARAASAAIAAAGAGYTECSGNLGCYLDEAFLRYQRENRIRSLEDVDAAVIEGASARVRPLVMTVATTVLGLLPCSGSRALVRMSLRARPPRSSVAYGPACS
jgi:hypothetical protein